MKAYTQELKEVYSKKSAIDEKMKKKLKKAQSLDKKKEVIESFKQEREEDKVDEDDVSLIRKPYIRVTEYLNQIDDKLKTLYEKYNEFKLNILYDQVPEYSNLTETQSKDQQLKEFDEDIKKFETDIEALKQLKIKQFTKINEKKEEIDQTIKELKLKIYERQQEYNETETIEDKKHIYVETVALKLQLFEIFRKNISVVNIESKTNDSVNKYSTLVIDYLPIKNNQKKMINDDLQGEVLQGEVLQGESKSKETKSVKLGNIDLGEVDLGEVELGNTSPPSPQYRPSEHLESGKGGPPSPQYRPSEHLESGK